MAVCLAWFCVMLCLALPQAFPFLYVPCTLTLLPPPCHCHSSGTLHMLPLCFVWYIPVHPSDLSSVVTSLGKLSMTR